MEVAYGNLLHVLDRSNLSPSAGCNPIIWMIYTKTQPRYDSWGRDEITTLWICDILCSPRAVSYSLPGNCAQPADGRDACGRGHGCYRRRVTQGRHSRLKSRH